jgi:hypothetical protein
MGDNMKVCSKCGIEKSLAEFSKDKQKKDGLRCSCKECVKKYNDTNIEHIKLKSNKWAKENIEKHKENCINWNKKNPEKLNRIKLNGEKIT